MAAEKVIYASTRDGVKPAVKAILEELNWESIIPRGEDLLFKINLTWDFIRPGVDTSPWVVEAVAEVLKDHAGQIFLGESSQILVNASRAFRIVGMQNVAERHELKWFNFSEASWKKQKVGDLEFSIPEICTKMPVISLPVVKTHYRSVISVALKNLYGCLDDNRHNYHYRLSDYIVAVNSVIPVIFTLADGTVSLEGNGPKPGISKQTDFIAASRDRVALDTSLAKVMGFDPKEIDSIVKADGIIGSSDNFEEIPLLPLKEIPRFRFQPAQPNFVAKVEKAIRGKRTGPGRDSPFLGIMKKGAKIWYNISYVLFGQKRQAEKWIRLSPYGPQWKGIPEREKRS